MNEPAIDALISEQQVMDFFAVVLKDEALLERVMVAMDANDDAAIISMASEYSYSFNQESLRQGLKKVFNLIAPTMLVNDSGISE
jgi:VCBS repeat-containing protein